MHCKRSVIEPIVSPDDVTNYLACRLLFQPVHAHPTQHALHDLPVMPGPTWIDLCRVTWIDHQARLSHLPKRIFAPHYARQRTIELHVRWIHIQPALRAHPIVLIRENDRRVEPVPFNGATKDECGNPARSGKVRAYRPHFADLGRMWALAKRTLLVLERAPARYFVR